MTRDDMSRWEAEIDSWRQRYEALLKTLADNQYLAKPMMLADKQSYELGLLHGGAAEREACAKVCEEQMQSYMSKRYTTDPLGGFRERFAAKQCAAAIRARSET